MLKYVYICLTFARSESLGSGKCQLSHPAFNESSHTQGSRAFLASLQSAQHICRCLSRKHMAVRGLVAVTAAAAGIPWLLISSQSGERRIKIGIAKW